MEVERVEGAEQKFRKAVAIQPDFAEAHNNLGIALRLLGRLDEAQETLRTALMLRPDYAEAHSNLGNVLTAAGRFQEAVQSYRQAIALRPDYADACSNLGNALTELGFPEEAERSCRNAVRLDPGHARAHINLGVAQRNLGRVLEAEQSFRQALSLDPELHDVHSNLAVLLNCIPGRTCAEIYAEHRKYGARYCDGAVHRSHRNIPEPGRRLRIGYVSGDFRDHSVAFFIAPVLAHHGRDEYETYCYYSHPRTDAVTRRLKSCAGHWRDIFGVDDAAAAELIADDGVDILVDLSGHTANNRLPMFARRPAPVQATWLGYLNTTGLDAMDWRITDARASPEGMFDDFHSEKLLRLPDSQWCYQPPNHCPDVAGAPGGNSGPVTFAAFCAPAKIGPGVIELWSRLLERVPRSRLLIVSSGFSTIPPEFIERFTGRGIPHERLALMSAKSFADYLALHNSVDVMLDTFPYTGGTTTCHALWMGVPVVSLAGETATSRGGASLLHAVGLGELVAQTPGEYLHIAAALAGDTQRLSALRAGLRDRMRSSPLTDADRFTRGLERAYRTMWRNWCENRSEAGLQ